MGRRATGAFYNRAGASRRQHEIAELLAQWGRSASLVRR